MKGRTPAKLLLEWYDRAARDLPWRVGPGKTAAGLRQDPYIVWLSEIMLQQTTVITVVPYFRRFLDRWPTVEALAAAPADDVLAAWAGLGYYARARNLIKCARVVADDHGGRFPDTEEALAALPGIGAYTAAAVAAIAFDRPSTVVDGNVERVVARYRRIATPLPTAKPEIRAAAAALTPVERAGDYAQAIMDLGATICTPRRPACALCPWMTACQARRDGVAEALPAKLRKPPKPTRRGRAFLLLDADGRVLLRRRPETGLLGGMLGLPTTEWRVEDASPEPAAAAGIAPAATAPARMSPQESAPERPAPHATWRDLGVAARHTFTHFHLILALESARLADHERPASNHDEVWAAPGTLDTLALPTVMRKALALGLPAADGG